MNRENNVVNKSQLGCAIVGCGLIGEKRARALRYRGITACVDTDRNRAEQLGLKTKASVIDTAWRAAITDPRVSLVIIATPHSELVEIAGAAIDAGKHVLIEKPGARSAGELRPLVARANKAGVVARVGFNHRYHRAFRAAKTLTDSGHLGKLMFVRARYGHGGRLGYESEWRADPAISGGGELLDQGVHLIDLARWFLGDFSRVDGIAKTFYWNMPVDDNAFMMLSTDDGRVAWLHASCTEWKNTFSFEIYGEHGKLHIDGLGGSYGVERLAYYKMSASMGPPETTIWEFPMEDDSWTVELQQMLEHIERGAGASVSGLDDAVAVLEIVDKLYRVSGYDHCS